MLHHTITRALVIGLAVTTVARADDPDWIAHGQSGMVATDSSHASRAGLEILKAGGNAFDATVAISFALAVTRPQSTGLGGGGFLIAHLADGRVIVDDFREIAPAAATADMYTRARGATPEIPSPSRYGFLAVGVPGTVAGRCRQLEAYGTMPLSRVVQPAIRLARHGFPVDAHYVKACRDVLAVYERNPALKKIGAYVYGTHLRDDHPRSVGDLLVQPQLANLIQAIGREGPEFFYSGPVAAAMADGMTRHGGIITDRDLADYHPKTRTPIVARYRGYELITMPPPSSGGIALAEALNILETFPLATLTRRDPALAVHYQIEAMKYAFADRAAHLADSDFANVPTGRLISQDYAKRLAATINPEKALTPDAMANTVIPEDGGTSHFCVVDRFGNAVVSTETINTEFGSLVAVDEWGLILNNQMDDFAAEPGVPNAFGLVQSERNAIEPGKKPLSSMAPTIVLRDGQPFLLLGASGGPRIISAVLNVILCKLDYALPLAESIQRSRPHHQWLPNQLFFDGPAPKTIRQALVDRGHVFSNAVKHAAVQAICRVGDTWVGASDPRKGGKPAGY